MPYHGHVENGVVVLDEPAPLTNGDKVSVEPIAKEQPQGGNMPLRGSKYTFVSPLEPAADECDWESAQ